MFIKENPPYPCWLQRWKPNILRKQQASLFTCKEGTQIANAVNEAINDAEGKSVTITSMGRNENGELIAEFVFTWSFKVRQKAGAG
jgi:hypothetical protein